MNQVSLLVTRRAPQCSPTKIELTFSDTKSQLISSLSDDLTDYRLESSTPGQISLVALESYKKRFHRAKAELSRVIEEKKELEEERELLRRAHVYLEISSGTRLAAFTIFSSPNSLNSAALEVVV
jgi:hypothetical protein